MSAARRLALLLSLFLLLAGVATSVAQEDTIAIELGWAASPLIGADGEPVAPAVRYRVYATRDSGPLTYLAEVVGDTLCSVELLRGATYRIRVVGFDAESRPSVPSEFSYPIYYAAGGDLTDVDDLPASGAAIESTYPNPFNPLIQVRYAVSAQDDGANLALDVLDVRGRLVRSLASGPAAAGRHEAAWDGTDPTGRRLPSGAYFIRLRSNSGQQIRPITMVK